MFLIFLFSPPDVTRPAPRISPTFPEPALRGPPGGKLQEKFAITSPENGLPNLFSRKPPQSNKQF